MIPVKDILKTLRTIINESATEEDSFTIETDEALKEFIRLALLALMNDEGVMTEASEMTDSSSISFEKRPDGLFFAYIKIPADYIRLVSVNLTGWRYPVTMLYPDNSPLYSAQYSSAPGVGNGPSIPVAFITNDTMRSIIAHAVKEQGGYSLRYIPTPSISENGEINFHNKYAGALAYYAAGLYHISINENIGAESEFAIARSLIRSHTPESSTSNTE